MNSPPPSPSPLPAQSKTFPSQPFPPEKLRRVPLRKPADRLVFSPLAWLKLMFFLHAGDTEIGGFGISAQNDPLYIEQFVTVDQTVSCVSVEFAGHAVADHFDRCVDAGLKPERFARIWCHTHPGASPTPSSTDEETFAGVFGPCDWSVMFIIGRTGLTYARLAFAAGPRAHVLLPVMVDWAAWPASVLSDDLPVLTRQWEQEYNTHIHPEQIVPNELLTSEDIQELNTGTLYEDSLDRRYGDWWDFEEYEPRHPELRTRIEVR